MKEPLVQILVEDIPESLRLAIENDGRERDRARNSAVCEILAARLNVAYTPGNYGWREADGTSQMNLRMPRALRDAIKAYADERGLPMRGVIVSTLQMHYDLPVYSPRKRPTGKPIEPGIILEARARHEAGESIRSLSRRFQIKRETLAKAIRAAA